METIFIPTAKINVASRIGEYSLPFAAVLIALPNIQAAIWIFHLHMILKTIYAPNVILFFVTIAFNYLFGCPVLSCHI